MFLPSAIQYLLLKLLLLLVSPNKSLTFSFPEVPIDFPIATPSGTHEYCQRCYKALNLLKQLLLSLGINMSSSLPWFLEAGRIRLQIMSGQYRRLSPSITLLIWGQRREVKGGQGKCWGHTYYHSRFSKLLVKYHCMPLPCSSGCSHVWTVLAFAAGSPCSLQRNGDLLLLLRLHLW